MSALLEVLPPRWRGDRFVLSECGGWGTPLVRGDERALLLVATSRSGDVVRGVGVPERVGVLLEELVAERADGSPVPTSSVRTSSVRTTPVGLGTRAARWLSVPRGTPMTDETLEVLGLVHVSEWDWLSTQAEPPRVPAEDEVRLLDRLVEAPATRACLRLANPSTTADPAGREEAAWWGIDDGAGGFAGVIGATARGGPGDVVTWHLHGLGVLPGLRGRGRGSALAAAATRAALTAGAAWVSLGMYADNDRARAVYEGLGYRRWARFTSYGPRGALPPTD